MTPLVALVFFLIVAILLVYLLNLVLVAAKIGDPWRGIILVLMLLGIVLFFARQFGGVGW